MTDISKINNKDDLTFLNYKEYYKDATKEDVLFDYVYDISKYKNAIDETIEYINKNSFKMQTMIKNQLLKKLTVR